jgi:glycosyltransferase involved in cell wall biosynthesis
VRIGFDVSQTGHAKAGCGYFADSLIRALAAHQNAPEWLLYSNFGEDFWDPDHGRATTRLPEAQRFFENFTHREAQAFWGNPPADFEARLGSPHIVHANNFYCPRHLKKSKLVYTLHDLAVFALPDLTTEANRLVCANGLFNASLHADLVLANSHFTRAHFLKTFPHFPEEQIEVVHPASRFSPADGRGRPLRGLRAGSFWLAVGTLEPRKNWRLLLETYAGMRRAGQTDRMLVLAGSPGWLEEGLTEHIRSLGIEQAVVRTGYVNDAQLRWLYANCFAFVYPSLFEGFGMPVLEALSMGAAVVTSNSSSLPEVAGEASILVDPESQESLARAMLRMETDPGWLARCRTAAPDQAAKFSWADSAARVLAHYEALAGGA